MRLGPKSLDLLDLLSHLSLDALEGILLAPVLYKSAGFASEKSFRARAKSLHEKGWIIWDDSRASGKWVGKITDSGLTMALGGIDPIAAWEIPWDGKWTIFSFDLPSGESAKRQALAKWLKQQRFGHLQGSLWIHPRKYSEWDDKIARMKIDPQAVIVAEGSLIGSLKNKDYAIKAWDFDLAKKRHKAYIDFLRATGTKLNPGAFAKWFATEKKLWRAAFLIDPLPPRELWPKDYLGQKAYKLRKQAYQAWSKPLMTI